MVRPFSEDDRITDWLDDIESASHAINLAQSCPRRATSTSSSAHLKRKLTVMDDKTPTKRTRVDLLTLTPAQSLRRTTSEDTRSSTTTSRSSPELLLDEWQESTRWPTVLKRSPRLY
ncbi:hypothetical protein LTS15_005686 [Exophiala xenobiotica]|nr:hypothetical protein LTS15_005686 [Exophiala xenobiotica]